MSKVHDREYYTSLIKAKCPDYPPASSMPDSICKIPDFFQCAGPRARDEFEDNFWAQERLKWYAACDSGSNLWLIKNPHAFYPNCCSTRETCPAKRPYTPKPAAAQIEYKPRSDQKYLDY